MLARDGNMPSRSSLDSSGSTYRTEMASNKEGYEAEPSADKVPAVEHQPHWGWKASVQPTTDKLEGEPVKGERPFFLVNASETVLHLQHLDVYADIAVPC